MKPTECGMAVIGVRLLTKRYKMNLITHAQQSIENAINGKSKIEDIDQFKQIKGMTSVNIQHLLNNLIDNEEVNYLEIGVYNGKSFFAAINNSKFNSAIAVDNFSQIFHDRGTNPSTVFPELYKIHAAHKSNVKFLNKDCWSITRDEIDNPINVYFYDGDHAYDAQYKALEYFNNFLTNEFILIVDDWSDKNARQGTADAIKNLNLSIQFEQELLGHDWWCDIKIFVLKKSEQ